jgi:hypothetical protein
VTQADDEPTERKERLRSFLGTSGQVVGQVSGAAIALVTGSPLLGSGAGALLGETLERVGLELHDRLLAPRQGARAAGALAVAAVRIGERLEAGDQPRADGFFDPGEDGRIDAEEVLEGTLLTAANSYEERKVPLVGRLYANLAFDQTVSAAHANFLLRLTDRLTYRQLAILAFFAAAHSGEYQDALVRISEGGSGPLPAPALILEMEDLSDARLLGLLQNDGSVVAPSATFGGTGWRPSNLLQASLTPLGKKLHDLMGLGQLARDELDAVLAELEGQVDAWSLRWRTASDG